MELVGTEVKKVFPGFGVFTGKVSSYDASAGFFRIEYEDGDSEEVDHEEITSILESMGVPSSLPLDQPKRSRGRPPKKRTKMEPDPVAGDNGETVVTDDGQLEDVKMEEVELGKRGSQSGKLRRSARRSSVVLSSNLNLVQIEDFAVSQDMDMGGNRHSPVCEDLVKPELPPSSMDLDLDGVNVFDFFAVYTFLRSFSRLLFISPFTLEEFLAALRCGGTNFLIDSVHYSIFQALRPHLEFLSEEGSEPARNCLRSLNWDILDLVTWPVFLAEYLLINASRMNFSFKLGQLNLFDKEYHEQPAGVKLEILRYLCDDVVEVEAIRLEVNRRMTECEVNIDGRYNSSIGKKRRRSLVTDQGSIMAQHMHEETEDGNSDECCLCWMDGSLICCDGCPAAFHSRCVGVAKDLLPEGKWFCPECVVETTSKLGKLSKTFRGAEFLGVDPQGRLYFGTCDHLLVSDSRESDASCHYYNKNDLGSVIEVLKPYYSSYNDILNSIYIYWGINSVDKYGNNNHIRHDHLDAQVQSEHLLPSKQQAGSNLEKEASGKSTCPENFVHQVSLLPNMELPSHMSSQQCRDSTLERSEPLDEMVHSVTYAQISEIPGSECCKNTDAPSETIISSRQTDLAVGSANEQTGVSSKLLVSDGGKGGASNIHSDLGSYVNYYCLGRISFSIGKELIRKLPDHKNTEPEISAKDLKSSQLKEIYKRSFRLGWYGDNKLAGAQKEDCGWCVSCRTSTDGCLFKVACDKNLESSKDKNLAIAESNIICSDSNKKSHITFAICHLLIIEDRICGLLSGLWEKPHYSRNWREIVSKALNAASLKPLLLSLESNLRRIALSVEWSKPIDYPSNTGAVSAPSTTPLRPSSNSSISRKQSKKINSGDEINLKSHNDKASDIYWWRGGKIARQAFQWKMLPRSLAAKGGRQAGRRKLPNMVYSDSSEFAKRIKNVAWCAGVERSKSVAQLIYQVQEFDANIKWMEMSETQLFPPQVSRKVTKFWKKAVIRRRHTEGNLVKYLLDVGKMEMLPPIVAKHAVKFKDSSTGRKRYWVDETLVPINVAKLFEEKRVARSLKRPESETNFEDAKKSGMEKKDGQKGFSYLMFRAQQLETELCGHCNKDVLVREAINCELCKGFFHRKHFRVPKGAVVTTYTCCKCKDKINPKIKSQGPKGESKSKKNLKGKKPQDVPSTIKRLVVKCKDRSTEDTPKRGKLILVISKKNESVESENRISGRKRDIHGKFIKGDSENPKDGNLVQEIMKNSGSDLSWHKRGKRKSRKKWDPRHGSLKRLLSGFRWLKRRRSVMHYPSWVNGLLLAQKAINEQQKLFKETKVLLPLQQSQDPNLMPVCRLCEEEFNSELIYIGCQNCGDWFHGDAFSLTVDNVDNVIGFKCHSCLMRKKPTCPFSEDAMLGQSQLQSRDNVGVKVVGAERQDFEERVNGGSLENYLTIVDNKSHLEEKKKDNILDIQIISRHNGEHGDCAYEDGLINGHIVDSNSRNIELDNDNYEHDSARLNSLTDERREGTHSKAAPVVSITVPTLGTPSQQLTHAGADVTSTKLEKETQVGLAPLEVGEELNRITEVTDPPLART